MYAINLKREGTNKSIYDEGVWTLPKDVSQTERTVLILVSQVNPTHFCEEV